MPISQLNKLYVAITAGDAAGIGPEITLKALSKIKVKNISFLIIGDYSVFKKVQDKLSSLKIKTPYLSLIKDVCDLHSSKNRVNFLDLKIIGKKTYKMSVPSRICGEASIKYMEKAVDLIKKRLVDTLVTAPINKKAINLAGYKWPGHTEFLAYSLKAKETAMMFVTENLKVILVTTHVPLSKVSTLLKSKDIFSKIKLIDKTLKDYFLVKKPLIGVCGLNPHASDGGLFGNEEKKIILPAVKKAVSLDIKAKGPLSAEALFYQAYHKKLDGLVCMYHDQALVPLKMILRDKAVNLTLGLPCIRTSPSSGTAYDISFKLKANCETMVEAVKLAIILAKIKKG